MQVTLLMAQHVELFAGVVGKVGGLAKRSARDGVGRSRLQAKGWLSPRHHFLACTMENPESQVLHKVFRQDRQIGWL